MNDVEYLFNKDCFEKKNVARSSHNRRTHNGKSGAVKLASDYMTKGQIKKMSGEVKSYRMNEPMDWETFKSMPDDLKVTYITMIRERFSAPDNAIAEMLGVGGETIRRWFRCLGLNKGKGSGGRNRKWDQDGFLAWQNGVSESPEPAEDAVTAYTDSPMAGIANEEKAVEGRVEVENGTVEDDEPGPIAYTGHYLPVIPSTGTMSFMNNNADDALAVIKTLLSNVRVNLTITWDCCKEA